VFETCINGPAAAVAAQDRTLIGFVWDRSSGLFNCKAASWWVAWVGGGSLRNPVEACCMIIEHSLATGLLLGCLVVWLSQLAWSLPD